MDLFGRAAEVQKRAIAADAPELAETISLYVSALNRSGREAEAEAEVREMVERSRSQDLVLPGTEAEALVSAAIILTSLSSQFLYGAHPNYHR